MKRVGVILVNYKDYAQRFLMDCRDSLRAMDYPHEALAFYIVDNETGDESFAYLQDNFSEAKILRNKNNDGFAKGNNDGMKVALADGCEYVFLLNMDTVIEPNALAEMVKTAEADAKIGAVQARLMLASVPLAPSESPAEGTLTKSAAESADARLCRSQKINSLGNITHFLGFGYSIGYGEEWKGSYDATVMTVTHPGLRPPLSRGELINIAYPSGAAVLFKKEVLRAVGLFDEDYWMYNEDQELGWRIWLSCWRCVLAPAAVVYHKYEFSRSIAKHYWMDRNRLLAIFECYEPLTLILIMPALLVMELGLTLFSIQSGWFNEKLKVWNYFLSYDNWERIKKSRARNQGLRKVRDKELARLITGKIWYQEVDDWKLRLINPIFNAYWQLVKVVLTFF
ncbi:MAG: glycosyltransferase family 2 protein [Patescibacteria group bacterium]|nr:glycosyltransferase family 2 protein [Patescibacteria group bacterium]